MSKGSAPLERMSAVFPSGLNASSWACGPRPLMSLGVARVAAQIPQSGRARRGANEQLAAVGAEPALTTQWGWSNGRLVACPVRGSQKRT